MAEVDLRCVHEEAMSILDRAAFSGDEISKRELTEQAFAIEKGAALELLDRHDLGEARSFLFKSAICIAMRLERYAEALELYNQVIEGNPPQSWLATLEELHVKIQEHLGNSTQGGDNN